MFVIRRAQLKPWANFCSDIVKSSPWRTFLSFLAISLSPKAVIKNSKRKFVHNFKLTILGILIALTTGCASITGSDMQQLSLTAKGDDAKSVEGVKCTLQNDKGTWEAITPSFINVRRSSEDLTVECKKDGEKDGLLKAISRAAGSMWGNIVFGGGIGAIIDHNKGTGYNYPDALPVQMGSSVIVDRKAQETTTAAK
ncbi:hypothetical protein [Rhodoferax lithotrophicus]|uniref:hypothetical protein n=1 Tax=Rhodoferax lithotrophicus TaxID=2798804 RepID=UPI001CC37656|nr:hypothetical protein [Rhodoferax sp. MIZ03]